MAINWKHGKSKTAPLITVSREQYISEAKKIVDAATAALTVNTPVMSQAEVDMLMAHDVSPVEPVFDKPVMSQDELNRLLPLDNTPKDEVVEVGIKLDGKKLRYDLLQPCTMQSLAKRYTIGVEKYAEDNWKTVPNFKKRYYAALMRHLMAWATGETQDPEAPEGNTHMEAVLWNAAALDWYEKQSEAVVDIESLNKPIHNNSSYTNCANYNGGACLRNGIDNGQCRWTKEHTYICHDYIKR